MDKGEKERKRWMGREMETTKEWDKYIETKIDGKKGRKENKRGRGERKDESEILCFNNVHSILMQRQRISEPLFFYSIIISFEKHSRWRNRWKGGGDEKGARGRKRDRGRRRRKEKGTEKIMPRRQESAKEEKTIEMHNAHYLLI